MSQADPSPRSEHRGPSPADPTVSAEHLLPPVEPPSAGFIVQLFVIPGLIVAAIVVIWLMFSWIARSATDAQSFLTELKRNNGSRWQAALNLATALHSDRQLRRDEPFARELTALLARESAAGETDDTAIMFRVYLCRALGEFAVPTPIEGLLQVADTSGTRPVEVRCAAIQAIAALTDHLRHRDGETSADRGASQNAHNRRDAPGSASTEPQTHSPDALAGNPWSDRADVEAALLKLAGDAEPAVRSNAAFALGVLTPTPAVQDKLHFLLNDSYADARFNAATALARTGDVAATDTLLEMLDPAGADASPDKRPDEQQAARRTTIQLNALRSLERLMQTSANVDRQRLTPAVAKLADSATLDATVRQAAKRTMLVLEGPSLP